MLYKFIYIHFIYKIYYIKHYQPFRATLGLKYQQNIKKNKISQKSVYQLLQITRAFTYCMVKYS